MPDMVFPAEVCSRIVRFAAESDLPALCRTSKLFQEHAEPRIYQDIVLRDPRVAPRICSSILAHEARRASYIRRLWVYFEPRLYPRGPLPEHFWRFVNDVFPRADNLESLSLAEPEACRSWISNPSSVHFQLREVSLHLRWDKHIAAFLHSQKRVRLLSINDINLQSDQREQAQLVHMLPDSLPELATFEGPIPIALELVSSPLRHIRVPITDEEDGEPFLDLLSKLQKSKTLHSINALSVPEYLVCDTLRLLADSPLCKTVRHIGVLALPLHELQRCDVHRSLIKFYQLEMVQLDLSHWQPSPVLYQHRMITTELRIYCPTVRIVFIWVGHHVYIWRCENEQWSNLPGGERRLAQDTTWRTW